MKDSAGVQCFLTDHLGSVVATLDGAGTLTSQQRYLPFGEARLTIGTLYTDRLFTGQREMAGLGVYHYGARFYSPKLGMFIQPDSIVPSVENPQSWNRYSYVTNKPIMYTDPTGHKCNPDDGCETPHGDPNSSDNPGSKEKEVDIINKAHKVGDVVTYEINGITYKARYGTDQKGNLILIDLTSKSSILITDIADYITGFYTYDTEKGEFIPYAGVGNLTINSPIDFSYENLNLSPQFCGNQSCVNIYQETTWSCNIGCAAGFGITGASILTADPLGLGYGLLSIAAGILGGFETGDLLVQQYPRPTITPSQMLDQLYAPFSPFLPAH